MPTVCRNFDPIGLWGGFARTGLPAATGCCGLEGVTGHGLDFLEWIAKGASEVFLQLQRLR